MTGTTNYACDHCGAVIASGFTHSVEECRDYLKQQLDRANAYIERLLDKYSACAADWLKERDEADRLSNELVRLQPSGEGLASGYVMFEEALRKQR